LEKKGVFAVNVTSKEKAKELTSYEGARGSLLQTNQRKITGGIFNTLKRCFLR
jgi:hypothetical protein